MKRNKENQIGFDSNTSFEGYDAKISESDMDKLWDLLQDPYKNSIGAVVREYVSNSFDSHAEAKFIKENSIEDIKNEYSIYREYSDDYIKALKRQLQLFDDEAVKVSISKDNTGWFWATEDFGVGLSPERVKDVFCNYLKSTKEDTNNLIGAFGIGSKSGLSYTDIVFIRTRYNNVEYSYMLRKGEKSPRLEKISEEITGKRNGTEIKIYIKNHKKYSWSNEEPEIHRFEEECRKQLAYFDNVYFSDKVGIRNDYKIIEGEHWKMSSNGNPFTGLHMCLGKVAYPIDWDSLGARSLEIPIALKFEIGELDIIQTREDVKYTPRTKQAIIEKIKALQKELANTWKATNDYVTESFLEYLKKRDKDPILEYNVDNINFTLEIKKAFSENSQNPVPSYIYKDFKDINFDFNRISNSRFFIDYRIPSYINATGLKHNNTDVYNKLNNRAPIYRIEGNHNTKKSKYIYQEEVGDIYYLLRRQKPSLKTYKDWWKLEYADKSEWRTIITAIQKAVKKCLLKNTDSYKKVEISQEWLKAQRKDSVRRDNTVFNGYVFDKKDSWSGAFKSKKFKKGEIDKDKRTLYIVGTKEDSVWLRFMYDVFASFFGTHRVHKYVKVMYVAPTNAKYVKDAKNLINPLNYMEHRTFIKYCTVHRLLNNSNKLISSLILTNGMDTKTIAEVNPSLINPIQELRLAVSKYNPGNFDHSEFFKSIYKHVQENNLWDQRILKNYDTVDNYFKNIPLLNIVDSRALKADDLAYAIYRFNKSVNRTHWKKLNIHYYINLNAEEQSWLSKEEKEFYNKLKLPA